MCVRVCLRASFACSQLTVRVTVPVSSASMLSKSVAEHVYTPLSVRLTDLSVRRPPVPLMASL